tara:strand:- start:4835 stop:5239 length:405 start_codon:yes stop_codon:yes gene_type:complete
MRISNLSRTIKAWFYLRCPVLFNHNNKKYNSELTKLFDNLDEGYPKVKEMGVYYIELILKSHIVNDGKEFLFIYWNENKYYAYMNKIQIIDINRTTTIFNRSRLRPPLHVMAYCDKIVKGKTEKDIENEIDKIF